VSSCLRERGSIRRTAEWMLMFCLAAGALACRGSDRSPVIATVNGRNIHRAQFERFLALKMGELTSERVPRCSTQMLETRSYAAGYSGH